MVRERSKGLPVPFLFEAWRRCLVDAPLIINEHGGLNPSSYRTCPAPVRSYHTAVPIEVICYKNGWSHPLYSAHHASMKGTAYSMTDSHHPSDRSDPQVRKASIKGRAIQVGNMIGVNAYHTNHVALKARFTEGGYILQETEHFLLCTRSEAPSPILLHWLSPHEIDANIGDVFMHELKPLGLLPDSRGFGDVFGAVVLSLFPGEPQRSLSLYANNTLQRYHDLLRRNGEPSSTGSTMNSFAQLYRRVLALQVGKRFLDAGCSFGFLPLLVAEQKPMLSQVIGVDIASSPFPIVEQIAKDRQLTNVQFLQADLLSEDVSTFGTFETVTALHVLEHFIEEDMYRVLDHLLRITSQKLILAVPYEQGKPEPAYGHHQCFTQETLEAVGRWCLQQWGRGSLYYEDCAGGLLMLERDQAVSHDTIE